MSSVLWSFAVPHFFMSYGISDHSAVHEIRDTSRVMAKGNRMQAFWASVANLKRPQMKEASTQTVETVEPGFRGEVEGAGGGGGVKIISPRSEVGEPDLEEIIRKLEAGHWRSPVTQIKKAFCDISNSMANGPPSVVAGVSSDSESELASTASLQ